MITLPTAVRIFLGSAPMDMRKSIDGLMAIVEHELRQDAYTGHLFVFVSRAGDRVKILTWDKGGFVLYYKRLERGRFRLPHMDPNASAVELDATQLSMLLDGIEYSRVRRPPAWAPGGRPMDKSSQT
ncbi:MAG: IS66 family insertion sequence element accessory protein TnpB [Anaeromyxobacteraceae bacterium]